MRHGWGACLRGGEFRKLKPEPLIGKGVAALPGNNVAVLRGAPTQIARLVSRGGPNVLSFNRFGGLLIENKRLNARS